MAFTNTARSASTASGSQSDRAGTAASVLDASTRARVQRVCDFVNAEVARCRLKLIAVGAASLVGMVLLPVVTKIVDARIALVIVAGIGAFWFVRVRRELAATYRSIATKRLVAATNKALEYRPVSSLKRDQFVSLDLFPVPSGGWQGVHDIRGRAGNATFSLHAVHARGGDRAKDVFRGAIIRVEFPGSFPGHTVVFPERHGPGGGGSSHAKRDLVFVRNPEFEHMFSAYSTEYMPAKQLFTAGFTQLIMAATETFGPDLRLAFVGRSLYVAVPNVTLLPDVTLLSGPLIPDDAAGTMVRLAAFGGALAREVGSTM
ncbi:MAG: DUF3137 domain-containing protein [Gemmatimonadaceae bacterium]